MDEDEAAVVRLIFSWYGVEYLGIAAIIRRLEALGIQRPSDRTNHRKVRGPGKSHYLCFPCPSPPFVVKVADERVWNWLSEEILDEQRLRRALELARGEQSELTRQREQEQAMLSWQVADLRRERDRLIRLYRSERIAEEEFDRHYAELSETLQRLEAQLAITPDEQAQGRIAQLEGALGIVQRDRNLLRSATYADRRRFVALMNAEVVAEWMGDRHRLHVSCDIGATTIEL